MDVKSRREGVCVCFLPPLAAASSLNGGLLNPAVSAVDSGNST